MTSLSTIALVSVIQILFAAVVTGVVADVDRSLSIAELQDRDPRNQSDLLGLSWIAFAMGAAGVIASALFLGSQGASPSGTAKVGLLLPALTLGGATILDLMLFSQAYYWFMPIVGWTVWYGVGLLIPIMPVICAISAGMAWLATRALLIVRGRG